MSDYRDFFIDGPRGPRRDPDAPSEFFTPGRTLAKGRASLTVTMTKDQKRIYLELGGAPWLKKVLTDALKAKTPNVELTGPRVGHRSNE